MLQFFKDRATCVLICFMKKCHRFPAHPLSTFNQNRMDLKVKKWVDGGRRYKTGGIFRLVDERYLLASKLSLLDASKLSLFWINLVLNCMRFYYITFHCKIDKTLAARPCGQMRDHSCSGLGVVLNS